MSPAEPRTPERAAAEQLNMWLRALNRTIAAAVELQNARAHELKGGMGPAAGISPRHADLLLTQVEAIVDGRETTLPPLALDDNELGEEKRLVVANRPALPLERLQREAGLTPFELAALLIIVAPQISSTYERLYGYLADDLTRLAPSIELILRLTHDGAIDSATRRRMLGPGAKLRRLGLVIAADPLAGDLRTVLEPAIGVADWLLGAASTPPVLLTDRQLLRPAIPRSSLNSLTPAARCLKENDNALVGMWGPNPGCHDDSVIALAAEAGFGVYHCTASADDQDWAVTLRREAAAAAGCNALLWIETKQLIGNGRGDKPARQLARLPQRMVLTGRTPWRPIELVGSRPYAEADFSQTPYDEDKWRPSLHGQAEHQLAALAARYRFGWRERQAAIRIATVDVRNRTNGTVPEFGRSLDRASRMVAAPPAGPTVIVHQPERTLEDLILPASLHDQIREIGTLVSHAGRVDAEWGFGRLVGSHGTMKVLMTGDPGTGKTLAAEAIAESAGLQLLKADLSQIVSKWVGETEKNLDVAFDHAEQSHSVLFFDEADALFGKRGEVRHGTDRYANLEVSYLLQRLETFEGRLVILASNLRDEIDQAFIRRFQVALHFPRPAPAERLRLWQLAFARAPLDPEVELEEFASFDMTGGSIAMAARLAALLTASGGNPRIGRAQLLDAVDRQFRKEARLMAHGEHHDGLSVARARC